MFSRSALMNLDVSRQTACWLLLLSPSIFRAVYVFSEFTPGAIFLQGTGKSSANTSKKQREPDAFREVEMKNRGM